MTKRKELEAFVHRERVVPVERRAQAPQERALSTRRMNPKTARPEKRKEKESVFIEKNIS